MYNNIIVSSKHSITKRSLFSSSSSSSTKTKAIQNLFEVLEKKYGGLEPFLFNNKQKEEEQRVLKKDYTFTYNDILKLMTHEISAIHINEYYPRQYAKEIGVDLSNRSIVEGKNWKIGTSNRGLESSDVMTIGNHKPYNVAFAQSTTNEYFIGVQKELHENRMIMSSSGDSNNKTIPRLHPLDKLRLELDEIWPSGAGLAREKNSSGDYDNSCRPFGGGLPRIMIGPTRWKHGFIHVDELGPLNDTSGLFSANIYLQLPTTSSLTKNKDNGAFQIWPLCIRSRWDWYKVKEFLYLSFFNDY